jgi:hypothetical protein
MSVFLDSLARLTVLKQRRRHKDYLVDITEGSTGEKTYFKLIAVQS